MARILITPRSLTSDPPSELEPLRAAGHELVFSTPGQTPDEAELLRLIPSVEGWLAGVEPVSEAVIAAAARLRVISRNGTGTDNLPLTATGARGIRIERAMAANATGVAELAIGLALAACRNLTDVSHGVRLGGWPRLRGREIEGETVGIIGLGAIGRKVAGVMAELGAKVIAADPFRPDLGALAGKVDYADPAEILAQAGILSLHCPMPEDGSPVIGAAALAQIRPGLILINTARAGLIDETALLAALEDGRVAAYGTDVFATEPPAPGGLAAHPRVIATSHIGGLTDASVRRATRIAVENLLTHLPGDGNASR
ncbi:phosphoglycerate dehydrogenase [Pseudogemmobacter bohemicus]|uniref:phosphoglycerate dehydrogenase n=1 Tax=Pseudogemmobacter bohemicus TaxID=2250708 RepID=UPI000DD4C3F8|nr:phosphoglycerate dehydrogenase [Pseudogemmobacter bohemicus]